MSRLYCMAAGLSEVADHFKAEMPAPIELPSETTEGAFGLVVFENRGRRLMRAVTWGFQRLTREMRERGEEPGRIGLVADLTNPMWDQMAADPLYRCLNARFILKIDPSKTLSTDSADPTCCPSAFSF